MTSSESRELRGLRKRSRRLEQHSEMLRQASGCLSQGNLTGKALPARERFGR